MDSTTILPAEVRTPAVCLLQGLLSMFYDVDSSSTALVLDAVFCHVSLLLAIMALVRERFLVAILLVISSLVVLVVVLVRATVSCLVAMLSAVVAAALESTRKQSRFFITRSVMLALLSL